MRATVITDASFCHETKASGYGIWITYDNRQGKRTFKSAGSFRDKPDCPFIAELWAVINGIDAAIKRNNKIILVQTDCLRVVNLIRNGDDQYIKLFENLKNNDGVSVKARHVKGHTKLEASRFHVNRWCDKVAKKAMRNQRTEFQESARIKNELRKSK